MGGGLLGSFKSVRFDPSAEDADTGMGLIPEWIGHRPLSCWPCLASVKQLPDPEPTHWEKSCGEGICDQDVRIVPISRPSLERGARRCRPNFTNSRWKN